MINKNLYATCNIAQKGFSGMRCSLPTSISLYFDSDVFRNSFQSILPTVIKTYKQSHCNVLNDKSKIELIYADTKTDFKDIILYIQTER